jgi:PAS domain S-box-containing protein
MDKQTVTVLLVEDDEDDVVLAREYLTESKNYSFEVDWEPDLVRVREKMRNKHYDIFLIDYRLGSENGLDLIKFAKEKGVLVPSILLTGQGDVAVDLNASRYGASDYLVKADLSPSLLERSIRYALSQFGVIRALDEKEKKYRSLFERSIDPIFLADENMKLIDVNGAFLNYFSYNEAEALSISIKQIFADQSDYQHTISVLQESEQIRDFEVNVVDKNGETKVSLLNCVFIADRESDFCCYQGIIHDLTLRKKAEKDMLRADRLSIAGKIARTMAHEVRNPLANLTLAFDQLKDEVSGNQDVLSLYGDIIERNAKRIDQLIGEMLNSSRVKELNLELTSIAEVMEETLVLAIDRIKLNQIEVKRSFDDSLPRLLIDKEKIKIAFLNIIINALEAMQQGEGRLQIIITYADGFIIVGFVDNGKGIAHEEIDKLFDPFYTSKQEGMGLGLTSTKNILNSHSATVQVKSNAGEGTTFSIYFKLPES